MKDQLLPQWQMNFCVYPPMKLRELYNSGIQRLRTAPALRLQYDMSETAALDARVLLCHSVSRSTEEFFMRAEEEARPEDARRFTAALERRMQGEPVAYITGRKEFYGLDFAVDRRVLIPRPDTETLVDFVLENFPLGVDVLHSQSQADFPRSQRQAEPAQTAIRLHDCFTGSGAIAIALQTERPQWCVSASDTSLESREIFVQNWERHIGAGTERDYGSEASSDKTGASGASTIPWTHRDVLAEIAPRSSKPRHQQNESTPYSPRHQHEKFDIITANPPYLSRGETERIAEGGGFEPAIALDGGRDGLDCIRSLAVQLRNHLASGGHFYIECADSQSAQIFAIFKQAGYVGLKMRKDLAGLNRVLRGVCP